MDATTTNQPVSFSTRTPYPLPSAKFMIPTTWRRYHLSQLVNKALGLEKAVPFDFLVKREILRGSLAEWCAENGVGEEETLEIEYIESVLPPQKMSEFPHESWVSAVSARIPSHFVTASYDGHLRFFSPSSTSQPVFDAALHTGPITSFAFVPSSSTSMDTDSEGETRTIISTSHDLTAQITAVTVPSLGSGAGSSKALATLHLHTAPLSSVAISENGEQVLTSSWDGLIGVWDTTIPASDEVPLDPGPDQQQRKKRRRTDKSGEGEQERPKRKAPVGVLKSHLGRVSKVAFAPSSSGREAVSAGFDSTIRLWDIEASLCTHTIPSSEKPFLDMVVTAERTALGVSTDRTMTLFDLRAGEVQAAVSSFLHPATPSCLALAPAASQVVTGAYDGVVRVWDMRSTKAAVASFKAFAGKGGDAKKVLSVDWERETVLVGGEGGVDVWKVQGGGEEGVQVEVNKGGKKASA